MGVWVCVEEAVCFQKTKRCYSAAECSGGPLMVSILDKVQTFDLNFKMKNNNKM
jgi:hypothetical protein